MISDSSSAGPVREYRADADTAARHFIEEISHGLLDAVPDAILVVESGAVVAVNDAACVMFGYPRGQLLRMSISDILGAGESARLPDEIARLADGTAVKSEWRFRRRDGSTFVGEVNARRVSDSRLLAVLRDVSERKRHEDEHERARRFIEAVAKASPSWIYVFDLDDRSLTYLNRSILRDLGYPPESEQITKLADFLRFLPEGDRPRIHELLDEWRALADDAVHTAEYRVLDAKGSVRWCLGREVVFTRNPDGGVHQVLGTLDDVTARRQADDALRRSEQRWQFALESAGDGVWDWDPRTGAAFYSARWKEMLGNAVDEVADERAEWSSRVHPDDLAEATAAIEAHLRGETPHFVNEHRMRRRDGRWLWVLDRGKVVEHDALGRPSRVVGTVTDITPLKLAIERLRESEERFRSLIDELDVGVLLQDATDDRIIMANRAAERMLGIPGPELAALSSHTWPWRLLREDGTEYARDDLPSVIAARTGEAVRGRIVGSYNVDTGVCVWLQVTAMPRRELGAGVRHVLVTMTDVTSRKAAEDALLAAREAWEQSFNALTDWVAVLDRGGYVVRANRAMRERFETQPDSLVGLHHLVVYEGEGGQDADGDACAPVLAGGPPVEFTTQLARVPGHFVVSCYPLPGAGGAVHVVRDITKQHQLEEQLRQSQKMHAIGQLAGGVAHDFNNLLTIIGSAGELALLALPPDANNVRDDINEIRRAADRAALLTRQLLLFGRKGVWEDRYVDINALVKDASGMLRRLLGEDVVVATSVRTRVAGTRGDPAQLEQVLMNLALNARDAMPNGGRLVIETDMAHLTNRDRNLDPEARPGAYVTLRVTDTGSGMSPEVRAHLFEPFFTTKGPGKGTGLGLSTVYGIVRQAGGFITVDSEPGAGTSFVVFLPAAPEKPEAPASAPQGHGATGSETVLIVEDEVPVRTVTVRSLQAHGFRVLDVATGAEALALIERDVQREIALLVTDVIMPAMGGGELAARARVIRPDLPVMFMSGYRAEEIAGQVRLAAGDRVLQKPFTAIALTTAVRAVLDARR